ncbi:MAG TPA: DUF3667 domain-containing protein [Casimicrobiaceae bacterium]|jgi:hypothetical protein|nr:DUF3667 domain-containing protein [Casimicrobiaceae bacterium]
MAATVESRVEETAPQTCRNCGARVDGAYCSACGQETKLRLPTLREFVREAAGRYVALDGRFWRTVFALLARPGFLTREYLAGRRRRYIRPARLYLFATLIFFAVTRLLVGPVDILEVHPDTPEESKYLSPEKGFNVQMGEDAFGSPALGKRWNRFNNLSRSEKAEQLGEGMLRYAPYAMFVLLPAFALLLKLVYLGRARRYPRRPRLFGEHLVFAAYDHAFVFVAATIMLLILGRTMAITIGLWIIGLYLLLSMRSVYGGSWIGLLLRAFVLFISYMVLVGLATAGLVVAAILLR